MPRTSFSPPSPDHLNTLTVRTRASGLQHVVGSHALAVLEKVRHPNSNIMHTCAYVIRWPGILRNITTRRNIRHAVRDAATPTKTP